MKPTHHFIKVNGIRMHYVSQGAGPLLILLHGFPEFWYGWRKQIGPLSQHFKVVVPDLRGYNKTDKPRGIANYDIEVLTEDIRALIRGLGEKKAMVAGHDWGGAIAWNLVIRTPEYVERLLIINLPHPHILQKHLRKNFRQMRRSWYFLWFQLPWLPELMMKAFLKTIVKKAFRGWSYNKAAFSDEDLSRYREMLKQPGTIRAAINYYRAVFRYSNKNNKGLEKPINVPIRMIWGENDKALGKELTYGTEKYVKGPFDIHYIPNCSHWVMSEYPEKVSTLMSEFFQSDKQQDSSD